MTPPWPFPAGTPIPDDIRERGWLADLAEPTDPALAEFIRLQIELESTPRRERTKAQFKRQNELTETHRVRWAGPMANQVLDFHFRGGFIQRVVTRWKMFFEHGAQWSLRHPIRDLILLGQPGISDGITAGTDHEAFPDSNHPGWKSLQPFFQNLESLDLDGMDLSEVEETVLLEQSMPRLRRLVVREIRPTLVAVLVKSGLWNHLTHLEASRQTQETGLRWLCRQVGQDQGQGPRIKLALVGLESVGAMIATSRHAPRFDLRFP